MSDVYRQCTCGRKEWVSLRKGGCPVCCDVACDSCGVQIRDHNGPVYHLACGEKLVQDLSAALAEKAKP